LTVAPGDPPDAGDDPGRGCLVVVQAVRGQRRQLEEGAARVEQRVDPLAGQQFAAVEVPLTGPLTAPEGSPLQLGGEVGGQLGMRGSVAGGVDRRGSGQHRCVHVQRLTLVHSKGPPHTPEWLTIVHCGASIGM
jgi:hypothetical protein